jgi:exoribonuclease-2
MSFSNVRKDGPARRYNAALSCADATARRPSLLIVSPMHVLYEESGSFKVGTVLADNDASLQIEAPHGKRSKIKANSVLLRFSAPAPGELLRQADALAAEMETDFLWECCGRDEFGFESLAQDYCGRPPLPAEAAGILVKLHSAPMYFYRRGKGRYQAAPPETLKAALASQARKRRQQQQIDDWARCLAQGECPDELRPLAAELLYKPDRNKPETRALEAASEQTGLSPPRLLERAGVLGSSEDYHLGRFLFEYFPGGTAFPESLDTADPADLPRGEAAAFSLDDASTTEIDDAFSLAPLDAERVRIGIHIAAPALGFGPGSTLDAVARARLSTVYMPGRKITMLPPEVVERYTLSEGHRRPVLSLYLDVRRADFAVEKEHTAMESVSLARNLRFQEVDALDQAFKSGIVPEDIPYASALHLLWRFAEQREAARGKPSSALERPDYNFHVQRDGALGERVVISERTRGTPLDKLVAELMILANSTWGKLLDAHDTAAVYRVQSNGKVRMSTAPAEHHGLGVSHYAWTTSPLRRYVDLVNQWQLIAVLRGEQAPFARNSEALLAAVQDFDATYAAYAEFQWRMERYWCLRWLLQERVSFAAAEVLRDNLVRLRGLPLYVRVPSMPALPAGTQVEVEVLEVDLLAAEVRCRYRPSQS